MRIPLLPDWPEERTTPAPYVECRKFADMITHCVVCRMPRNNERGGLNDSGYCQLCWQHIPERFRTAANRLTEERRMRFLLVRESRRLDRELPLLIPVWCEDRNSWMWRKRGQILPTGQIILDFNGS